MDLELSNRDSAAPIACYCLRRLLRANLMNVVSCDDLMGRPLIMPGQRMPATIACGRRDHARTAAANARRSHTSALTALDESRAPNRPTHSELHQKPQKTMALTKNQNHYKGEGDLCSLSLGRLAGADHGHASKQRIPFLALPEGFTSDSRFEREAHPSVALASTTLGYILVDRSNAKSRTQHSKATDSDNATFPGDGQRRHDTIQPLPAHLRQHVN